MAARNRTSSFVAALVAAGLLAGVTRGDGPAVDDDGAAGARDRLLGLLDGLGPPAGDARARVAKAKSVEALGSAVTGVVSLRVHINPESRVKLHAVTPIGDLVVGRPRMVLVEVVNEAGVTAALVLEALDLAGGTPRPATFCTVTLADDERSSPRLSGAPVEWKLATLTLARPGRFEVRLEADVGQGTQDLGFRATADLLLRGVAADHEKGSDR
ncbi:MAG: hypothetical protein ACKO9B_06045 [Planctomycetota bacterium]